MTEAGTIVDRAASKRTRRDSPGSLAVSLPGLREPVPAPESKVPKGNLLEEQLLLRGAAYLTWRCFGHAWAEAGSLRAFSPRSPLYQAAPEVGPEGGREQKELFTVKQGLCERPVAWKKLAPGGEL